MAQPGTTSLSRYAMIAEITRGITPATPAYNVLPFREATAIDPEQTFDRNDLVRSDRMGGQQIGGTRTPKGTIETALVNETTVQNLIESAIGGKFTAIALTASGGFTASTKKFTRTAGSFLTDPYATTKVKVGDILVITGSVSNNGTKTVATIDAGGLFITFNEACVDEAGPVAVTFTAKRKIAIAGTTRSFFSIEKANLDLATYQTFKGMEVGDMTIDIPTSGAVKITAPVVGISSTEVQETTPTYVATNNNVPMSGSVQNTDLEVGAVGLTTMVAQTGVETVKIDFKNSRAPKYQVGSQTASHIEEGDFDSEVMFNIYKFDNSYSIKYNNGTRISAFIKCVDQVLGDAFVFNFPRLCITKSPDKPGKTITQDISTFAEYDSTFLTKCYVELQPAS